MDGNISEMLGSVLSDPEAMKKLMGVAQSLMGSGGDGNESEEAAEVSAGSGRDDGRDESTEAEQHRKPFPLDLSANNERIALISALRPYLSPDRREIADSLIKMMKMMKLADIGKLMKD